MAKCKQVVIGVDLMMYVSGKNTAKIDFWFDFVNQPNYEQLRPLENWSHLQIEHIP